MLLLVLLGCAAPPPSAAPRRLVPVQELAREPGRLRAGTLLLEDRYETDMVPPGSSTTTLTLQLRDGVLHWTRTSVPDLGDVPPTEHGELRGDAARRRLAAVLRKLDATGVLALPSEPAVEQKIFFDSHQLTLGLELVAASAAASYQRRLPFGAETGAFGRQADTLRRLLRGWPDWP